MTQTALRRIVMTAAFLLMMLVGTAVCFADTAPTNLVTDENDNEITQVTIQNRNTTKPEAADQYAVRLTSKMLSLYQPTPPTVVALPVKVATPGTITINMEAYEIYDGMSFSLHTYCYPSEADRISRKCILTQSNVKDSMTVKVKKAGTYYLRMAVDPTEHGITTQTVVFNMLLHPAGGTLKSGTTFYGSSSADQYNYYKITCPGNGYLTLDFPVRQSSKSSYKVQFLDAKKKNLLKGTESVTSAKKFKTRFGVKKGTYYIAVKNGDSSYGIRAIYTAVKEKSGASKKKAVKLSKKQTRKGIITANQSASSADWYKFTLKKNQKVTLNISTLTGGGGGLKVYLYQKNKKKAFAAKSFYYSAPSKTIKPYTKGMKGKLAKGTYYIKVVKYNGGSGYYKIRWK